MELLIDQSGLKLLECVLQVFELLKLYSSWEHIETKCQEKHSQQEFLVLIVVFHLPFD